MISLLWVCSSLMMNNSVKIIYFIFLLALITTEVIIYFNFFFPPSLNRMKFHENKAFSFLSNGIFLMLILLLGTDEIMCSACVYKIYKLLQDN